MIRFETLAHIAAMTVISVLLVACGNTDRATQKDASQQAAVVIKQNDTIVATIADMSPLQLMDSAALQSNQLADILGNVKDEASADVAATKVRALGPQLKAVSARLDTLTQDDMKLSLKSMNSMQSFAEAQMRIFNEAGRIAKNHPELHDTIIAGFEDIEIDVP